MRPLPAAKEFPDLSQDFGLWEEIEAILRPVMVKQFVRYYRLGFVVAVLEMDAARKEFAEDVVARADALLTAEVQQEFGALGDPTFPIEDWAELNQMVDAVYASSWWDGWSRNQRAHVGEIINRANVNGASLAEVTEEIGQMMSLRSKAELIASTEMTNIMGLANQTAYRRLGFAEWEWRTAADRRVDPICEELDGETFEMAVTFSAAHPRCRCWPVPVPDSLDQARAKPRPRTAAGDVYPPDFRLDRQRKGTPYPEGGFATARSGENWFKERYPWITPTLSRMNVTTMNAQLQAFDLLAARFPYVTARMTQFGTKALSMGWSQRVYAHANRGGNGIGLNPSWHNAKGKNSRRYSQEVAKDSRPTSLADPTRAEALPWHPAGTGNVASVVVHEFGHLVDGYLDGATAFRSGSRRGSLKFGNNPIPGMASDTWIRLLHGRVHAPSASPPSRYATKNAEEAYAEAFSQWFASDAGLPGALSKAELSPHAKAIGRFMEEFPPDTWAPSATTRDPAALAPENVVRVDNEITELMKQ